ncbi:EcsC family protein [Clostridium celatum]|uniref:EcsC family protein n=1 Tax=Clostridium celatum DSM 1785 TaxID=545697 RepID=L1Q457_9CLOT|nr:EcsC family protein [Clostridium celatum]EKY22763.1 hypothetical protein HMPREF0216_03127 [Clostridium celatum DSM 1785]MCE9653920.1 EcsC family protein [Clostridium celatum]MDU2266816.1 EcsC family protein [Clostridium celatum]MDU3722870.1 EcsC family protein [Clostridium celatum]MDU6297273.1 EcsC family protein [Clostridium celatum]
MKKNKNNLIQKQLMDIYKKEAKLLEEKPPSYIKNKLSPIKETLEDKIPDKLQSTLELAFEKGFKVVFDKGVGLIEKTYNRDNINMEFDINTYAIEKYPTKRNFKKIDKSANRKTMLNKSISAVEGTALGLLGIGLPDIPIYIGVILKSIYEISLSYGFNYNSQNEKAYILTIICAAVTSTTEKKYYFDKLDKMANEIDANKNPNYQLDELLKETSNKISTYMLTSKFIQGLPLIGVVGGVTNFKTLQDISTIAKLKYKKRYLNNLQI